MKALVVAAHPDDEVLGCGGVMSRLAADDNEVFIGILGEGLTSRFDNRGDCDSREIEALHERSRRAAELIGAKDLFFSHLPDNRYDTVPLLNIVKIIEDLIYKIKPEVVFTHHGGDLNIDHVLTFRATLTATRPTVDSSIRSVYAYEVASSTEWAFQQFSPNFHPDTFWDVSAMVERKIQAMQQYETEARVSPHPRSPEMLRAQAYRLGAMVGMHAAEAFQSIRVLK